MIEVKVATAILFTIRRGIKMVYTITLNPSLDYIVSVPNYKQGFVNRTTKEEIYPGGKGINVSIVLNNLGVLNKALGFVAGFTGDEINKRLQELGCATDFIVLNEGMSRINVKIKGTKESEINGQGPAVKESEIKELYCKLSLMKEGDYLVLAGSIPSTLPENIYEEILETIEYKKILVIVDTHGNALRNTLKYRPFLIKPNQHELGELFGVTISTVDESVIYAKKLQAMGARNVLISMARKGAILLTEENELCIKKAPTGTVINSVGAGDSMVAGFIAGYINTKEYEKAFQLGIAAGSASAFAPWLPGKEEIFKLLTNE